MQPPPMNASTLSERQSLELVDIIDFKWLMSSIGLRVHVERLQSDRAYAADLLGQAARSQSKPVREAACRLRVRMGLASA